MGLVDILSKKLNKLKVATKTLFTKTPKNFVFTDMNKNFYKNQKLYLQKWNSVLNDSNVILRRKGVEYFLPEFEEGVDELTLDIMEITNSENFSCNFADLISSAKLYAVNFMATDEGKTKQEISTSIIQLSNIIDCMNFNTIAHIDVETIYNMEIVDGKIRIFSIGDTETNNNPNLIKNKEYPFKIIMMQNRVVCEILSIAEGILNKNNTSVYQAFAKLCDKELYDVNNIVIDVKEIDLQ